MIGRSDPRDPEDFLTASDVPELPNGMATVVTVEIKPGQLYRARIGKDGYLRTLDEEQLLFKREYVDAVRVE